MQPLPIDPFLEEMVAALSRHPSHVVQASPGSGKTTRLPPALLAASWRKPDQEILVLEPRRLAAKYAARRVADERREPVGETVGYQFRFENVGGPRTRLRFLTEGMLMRRLLSDRKLERVAAVVLDEFHERHLHGDLALAYLRQLQSTDRPDLKLVVMSATLDTSAIAKYLNSCPVTNVETRQYPVTVEYLPAPPAKKLDALVHAAVLKALGRNGDILVFLPGMGEIRFAESALQPLARSHNVLVLPLHGELSREAQDLAIQKADRTKVILSTNVAETSLTIEGITTVIDSGLHRQASYSWWSGVPALRTRPTSRASAEQRAGRAGRLSPGTCQRLYTKGDFETRPAFDVPEIQRADLAQTLLELKTLGILKLGDFPWVEAPQANALTSAATLLFRLGATTSPDVDGRLTTIGKRMASIPAHPRLARLLLEGEKIGRLEEAATLAAKIAEGRLETLDALEDSRRGDEGLAKVRRQLLGSFKAPSGKPDRPLSFAVLTGFPDRVAKKRAESSIRVKTHEAELILSSGGSALVEDKGIVTEGDTFVALDIQERQFQGQAKSKLKIHSLCLVQPEWLFDLEPSAIVEGEQVEWEKERERVIGVSRLSYDQITLVETKGEPKDADAAAKLLFKIGLGLDTEKMEDLAITDWISALGKVGDREILETTVARLILMGVSEAAIKNCFPVLLADNHAFSMKELRALDWPSAIMNVFPEQASRLNRSAPLSLALPSGRTAKICYALGKTPWVESRLQDFMGLSRGPAILDGKLPLTLHLLAPNYRAVQVTSDLAGFWKNTYPAQRKELGRKYPRHAWPEDPLVVPPPRKKRG